MNLQEQNRQTELLRANTLCNYYTAMNFYDAEQRALESRLLATTDEDKHRILEETLLESAQEEKHLRDYIFDVVFEEDR